MNQLRILDIINKNKDKNLIYRLLNAKDLPSLPNRDGSVSTHGMRWRAKDSFNDAFIVYPTVVLSEGEMMRLGPKTAFNRALELEDYIEFRNAKDAEEFSKEYKKFEPFFVKTDGVAGDGKPMPPSIWKNIDSDPGPDFNQGF